MMRTVELGYVRPHHDLDSTPWLLLPIGVRTGSCGRAMQLRLLLTGPQE